MTITITNLIIHQIHKSQPKTGQQSQKATSTNAKITTPTKPGDNWHALVESVLHNTNDDRRLRRGQFKNQKGFKDEYDDYTSAQYDFIQLSSRVTKRLMGEMDKSTMSTGGFILFAEITQNGLSCFYCIMFKEKMGENLQYNNTTMSFDLKNVVFLDLEKMHQGFCLEVDNYNNAKHSGTLHNALVKPYLYFINMQKSDKTNTSKYFINTFDCIVTQNSSRSMDILISKTIDYFEQDKKLNKYLHEIRKDIYNYYKQCSLNQNDIQLIDVENIITSYTAKESFSQTDQKKLIDTWFKDLVHDPKNPISASFPIDPKKEENYGIFRKSFGDFSFSGSKDSLINSTPSDDVYYDKNLTITITLTQKID